MCQHISDFLVIWQLNVQLVLNISLPVVLIEKDQKIRSIYLRTTFFFRLITSALFACMPRNILILFWVNLRYRINKHMCLHICVCACHYFVEAQSKLNNMLFRGLKTLQSLAYLALSSYVIKQLLVLFLGVIVGIKWLTQQMPSTNSCICLVLLELMFYGIQPES